MRASECRVGDLYEIKGCLVRFESYDGHRPRLTRFMNGNTTDEFPVSDSRREFNNDEYSHFSCLANLDGFYSGGFLVGPTSDGVKPARDLLMYAGYPYKSREYLQLLKGEKV